MDETYLHLKHSRFFERLPDEQIAELAARAQLRRFDPGAPLFNPASPGDCVLLLISGRVRLYHVTPAGKQILLGIINPGEIFGEIALLVSGERAHFAEPMERSTIVVIPAGHVKALVETNPELCLRAAELALRRRIECERRLISLLFRPVRDRLIALLLDLAEKYGEAAPEGLRIGLPLSQQDLSSAIGSTRETVSLSLGELQSAGHIRVERRQVTLMNVEALRATVDQEKTQGWSDPTGASRKGRGGERPRSEGRTT